MQSGIWFSFFSSRSKLQILLNDKQMDLVLFLIHKKHSHVLFEFYRGNEQLKHNEQLKPRYEHAIFLCEILQCIPECCLPHERTLSQDCNVKDAQEIKLPIQDSNSSRNNSTNYLSLSTPDSSWDSTDLKRILKNVFKNSSSSQNQNASLYLTPVTTLLPFLYNYILILNF